MRVRVALTSIVYRLPELYLLVFSYPRANRARLSLCWRRSCAAFVNFFSSLFPSSGPCAFVVVLALIVCRFPELFLLVFGFRLERTVRDCHFIGGSAAFVIFCYFLFPSSGSCTFVVVSTLIVYRLYDVYVLEFCFPRVDRARSSVYRC